jgi:hypothetical protein
VNILKKQLQTRDKGWSSSLGFVQGVKTSHCEKPACYKILQGSSDL